LGGGVGCVGSCGGFVFWGGVRRGGRGGGGGGGGGGGEQIFYSDELACHEQAQKCGEGPGRDIYDVFEPCVVTSKLLP